MKMFFLLRQLAEKSRAAREGAVSVGTHSATWILRSRRGCSNRGEFFLVTASLVKQPPCVPPKGGKIYHHL